jgi:hypothetical protein
MRIAFVDDNMAVGNFTAELRTALRELEDGQGYEVMFFYASTTAHALAQVLEYRPDMVSLDYAFFGEPLKGGTGATLALAIEQAFTERGWTVPHMASHSKRPTTELQVKFAGKPVKTFLVHYFMRAWEPSVKLALEWVLSVLQTKPTTP